MLELFIIPQIEDIPTSYSSKTVHPPLSNWSRHVRDCLDEHFPRCWIGGGSPIAWPAHSPDIILYDFFVWGFIKDIIYKTKVRSIIDLQEYINRAFHHVTPEILQHTWMEVEII